RHRCRLRGCRGGKRAPERDPARYSARRVGDGRRGGHGSPAPFCPRALRSSDRQHPGRTADRAGGRFCRRGRTARTPAPGGTARDAGTGGARGLPHRRLPPRRKAPRRRLVDPMAQTARRLIKALGAVLAGIVLALLLFALAGWIGSSLPRNADWQEPQQGIEIMVGTNGVHTELILPLVTAQKDWRFDFPAADLPLPRNDATHV